MELPDFRALTGKSSQDSDFRDFGTLKGILQFVNAGPAPYHGGKRTSNGMLTGDVAVLAHHLRPLIPPIVTCQSWWGIDSPA
jgi:hypothetical protein